MRWFTSDAEVRRQPPERSGEPAPLEPARGVGAARPVRARWLAPGVLLAVCGAVVLLANLHWLPEQGSGRWVRAPAFAVSGDEPHYLIMIHSLLADGDLDLGNQYRRAAAGGPEAGGRFRGIWLDHHTFLVDPRSGRSELWHRIYDLERPRPCTGRDCVPYEQRQDSPGWASASPAERPAHPFGYPLLAAAFAAIYRPDPDAVEPLVARFAVIVSLLTVALTYLTARGAGLSEWPAVAAAALLALASPWLAYTKSFYSEPLLGLCMATAAWGLVTRRAVAAALALALAFAVKPPFALVAMAWFAWLLRCGRRRDALWLLAIPGAAAAGTALYDQLTAHQLVVSGALGWRWADGGSSLLAALFSRDYGLLPFAPWLAIPAIAAALRGRPGFEASRPDEPGLDLSFAAPLLLALLLYLLVVSLQASVGGRCYGPRYWIPFMPWFAVLAVALAVDSGWRWQKLALAVAALGTAGLVIPATLQYYRVWDQPAWTGLLALWGRGP